MTRLIDETLIEMVDNAIRKGVPLDKIPGIIGVTPQVFHNWLAKGRDKQTADHENPYCYIDLYEVVAKGRGELIQDLLDNVLTVANDTSDPKLSSENSKWLLSKLDKEAFGNKPPVQVTINHKGEGRDVLTEAEKIAKTFSPEGLSEKEIKFINGFDESEIIETEKVGGTYEEKK